MDPTLNELLHANLEWIFVGGKGGGGKTTTSAALAVRLASTPVEDMMASGGLRSRRVLLISFDAMHSLSDVFGQRFSAQATPVAGFADSLSVMEIDVTTLKHGSLLKLLTQSGASTPAMSTAEVMEVMAERQVIFEGLGDVLKEAARTMPGIDELSIFEEVVHYVSALSFDVLVFDTAPTGHMLRMLAAPQMLNSAYERLLSLEGWGLLIEAATHIFAPKHRDNRSQRVAIDEGGEGDAEPARSANGEVMNAHTFVDSAVIFDRDSFKDTVCKWRAFMQDMQKRFTDADRTSFLCVCVAEFSSVYETERLVQELMKNNVDCSSIVVNQILLKPSDAPPCRMCAARMRTQNRYLEQIDKLYDDFHVVRMPLLSGEVRGLAALEVYERFLFEPYDPNTHGDVDVEGPC